MISLIDWMGRLRDVNDTRVYERYSKAFFCKRSHNQPASSFSATHLVCLQIVVAKVLHHWSFASLLPVSTVNPALFVLQVYYFRTWPVPIGMEALLNTLFHGSHGQPWNPCVNIITCYYYHLVLVGDIIPTNIRYKLFVMFVPNRYVSLDSIRYKHD